MSDVWGFPNVPLRDDMNRADNASPGANWTESIIVGHSGVNVRDNGFNSDADAVDCSAWWNVETFGPDCEAAVQLTRDPSSAVFDVFLRLSNPGTGSVSGYRIRSARGVPAIQIHRLDNGTLTQLGGNIAITNAVNDWIGAAAYGPYLLAWTYRAETNRWDEVLRVLDRTYQSAGYAGLGVRGTAGAGGVLVDNFYGGTLAPGRFVEVARRSLAAQQRMHPCCC